MDDKRGMREETCHLMMEDRRRLSVTGVIDVDSFDETNVILLTEMGALIVKGTDFHINKLSVDTGEMVIEGNFDSLGFSDSYSGKGRGSLLSKLFK